jgi:hypothetical protein
VLAWSGDIPLPPLLTPLGDTGLKMMTRHEGVEYSNPMTLTEDEFRQWPEKLNESLTNLHAELSGFVLKQVFSEGTSEPFMARLMATMAEIRDRAVENVQERRAFDTAYSPVLDNLIEARRVYRQSSVARILVVESLRPQCQAPRLTLWQIRPCAPYRGYSSSSI